MHQLQLICKGMETQVRAFSVELCPLKGFQSTVKQHFCWVCQHSVTALSGGPAAVTSLDFWCHDLTANLLFFLVSRQQICLL